MTARQPRRTRRRNAPAAALPRLNPQESGDREHALHRPIRTSIPEHHVSQDYGYVRRDLLLIAGVTTITFAFVVLMSFVV